MDTYGSHEGYLFNLKTCSSSEAKRMWRESIKSKWNYKCAYCGSPDELTLDHIVPSCKGGTNYTNNVLCACRSCNASKGHEEWQLWYVQQPFFSEYKRQLIEDWIYDEEVDENLVAYSPRRNMAY